MSKVVSAERISAARTSTEKEAKALSTELANLLTKKDPWHQDVVFARENLRRHCLAIIFQAPTASNAANPAVRARKRLAGLNVLFLSTSHNVIHHYRQRISAMDAALSGKNGDKGGSKRSSSKAAAGLGPTPGQRRKLLHSFRDFLAVEETFWRDLLIRIVGVFDVEEARTSLRLLQIGIGDWEPDPALAGDKQSHDTAILLCHKSLICFGDLARYRELYSDKVSVTSKHKQASKPGTKDSNAEKTFARAYEAYHQARLLIPDDGNPSNQLAVLAGYQSDQLSCIYHYYRALCVRKAFTTATQNLSATMSKIITQWETEEAAKRDKRRLGSKSASYADLDEDEAEKLRRQDASEMLEQFKKTFIVLHAVLFKGTNVDKLPALFMNVNKLFSLAVHNRILPSDVIVKTVVTALGSWWYARMYRQTSTPNDNARASSASLESSALMHSLAIITELMNVGTGEVRSANGRQILQQVSQASKSEQSMILAQSVSAVLRRTLPALRIASMWLLSNGAYLSRYDSTTAQYKPDDPNIPQEVCIALRGFWSTYTTFINALQTAFPASVLPSTSGDTMLEEDVDMLGFAPLRRRMTETSAGKTGQGLSGALATSAAAGSALHPNEEQVLRIADLLADANLLALSESCPVVVERGHFVIRKKQLNPASQPWNPSKLQIQEVEQSPLVRNAENSGYYNDLDLPAGIDDMDASDDEYEATEDDVLDLAMRVATGAKEALAADAEHMSDEEDDDEVLWRPQAGTIGDRRSSASIAPLARKPFVAQAGAVPSAANPTSRTASDLLLQVLQGSAMDMSDVSQAASDFFADQDTQNAAYSGLPDNRAGLVTRSIWSSGSGNLPAPLSQTGSQQRPTSGQQSRIATQTASAEALFNSMPNQSQHNTGSNRSSPNLSGSAILDPLKRNVFTNAEAPVAPLNGQQDIWNPPSPRGIQIHDSRTQHGPIRAPYQQVTRQYG